MNIDDESFDETISFFLHYFRFGCFTSFHSPLPYTNSYDYY